MVNVNGKFTLSKVQFWELWSLSQLRLHFSHPQPVLCYLSPTSVAITLCPLLAVFSRKSSECSVNPCDLRAPQEM